MTWTVDLRSLVMLGLLSPGDAPLPIAATLPSVLLRSRNIIEERGCREGEFGLGLAARSVATLGTQPVGIWLRERLLDGPCTGLVPSGACFSCLAALDESDGEQSSADESCAQDGEPLPEGVKVEEGLGSSTDVATSHSSLIGGASVAHPAG